LVTSYRIMCCVRGSWHVMDSWHSHLSQKSQKLNDFNISWDFHVIFQSSFVSLLIFWYWWILVHVLFGHALIFYINRSSMVWCSTHFRIFFFIYIRRECVDLNVYLIVNSILIVFVWFFQQGKQLLLISLFHSQKYE
jgi:hypothetical protein